MPNVERDIRKSIPREGFARRGITEAESREDFVPSRDMAWIIGVLAGGGYANPDDKRISIDSNSEKFLDEFKTAGERVFRVNSVYRTRVKSDGKREAKGVTFYSRKVALMLGDLGSPEWPDTIINRHKWIVENTNYLWGFIEGIFERKGNVFISKNRVKGISIGTDYVNVANFVAELLVRLGIKNPRIEHNKRGKQGIKGVRVHNIQDMKHFAENVHSKIPEKESRLSDCRELEYRRKPVRTNASDLSSIEGGFPTARDSSERTIFAESVNFALKQYEEEKGVQIRYSPKLHRQSELEEKRKLEEIFIDTKESPEPQVLFGSDSKSPIFPQAAVDDHIRQIAESDLENKLEPGTELYVGTTSGQEKLLQVLPKGSKRNWTPEDVRREAAEFFGTFGRLSNKIIIKLKRWDLQNAIKRYPGKMRQLKVDLGLEAPSILSEPISLSSQLSTQQIEEEVLIIYQKEGKLTKRALENQGRNDLIWAIRKHYHGRYKGLRDKLGLQGPVTIQRVDKKPSGYWNVEQIEKEAQEFYLKSGKLSHRSLRENRQDLLHAVRDHYPGGLSALKEKIGALSKQEMQIFS